MTDPDQAPTRNKGGRPPKDPEKGKRQNFTFRMSETTRQSVQKSADQSGRSLSEEIERRVERSLDHEETINALIASWEISDRTKVGAFITLLGGVEMLFYATAIGTYVKRFLQEKAPAGKDPMVWLTSDEGKELLAKYIKEKASSIVTIATVMTEGQDMKKVAEGMLMLDFKEVRQIVEANQSRT